MLTCSIYKQYQSAKSVLHMFDIIQKSVLVKAIILSEELSTVYT